MREDVDLILTGGIVITMNSDYETFADGAVAIREHELVAVGPAEEILEQYKGAETVDCQGGVIMPGLINAHTHLAMSLFRGLKDDLRLDVWLGYLMPLEREFVTPEFVALGTRLACAEMIRSGVTAFADMYYFEETVAEVTAEIGMRGLLGQTVLISQPPTRSLMKMGSRAAGGSSNDGKPIPWSARPLRRMPGIRRRLSCCAPALTSRWLSTFPYTPISVRQRWRLKTAAMNTTAP
jgi:cytosine/adenosine deaminase-related metal-dependent hydrolase